MSRTDTALVPLDDEIAAQMLGQAEPTVEDAEATATAIVARILEAPDVDSVFEQGSVTPIRDLLDTAFIVTGLHFNRSGYEGGASVYAIMDVQTVEEKKAYTVSCGARNVMAQLYKLAQLKALDGLPVKVVEAGQTAAGFKPMWLQKA